MGALWAVHGWMKTMAIITYRPTIDTPLDTLSVPPKDHGLH